jgi:hypothetical protein
VSTETRRIGRSVLALGPSGSGKSHLLRTALRHYGSGVMLLALGSDEIESYREFYEEADFLTKPSDLDALVQHDDKKKPFLATEKPYLLAAFDDTDFLPSIGEWTTQGHASMVKMLRLLRQQAQKDADEGRELRYQMVGLDTYSGVGELAHNAMCSVMRITEPPKARGDGGAQYYIGYRGKLVEVARACRSLRGYGMSWFATSHVQVREASDTFSGADVAAKEQQMALFTGSFREQLPGFFDLVMYTGISAQGKHYAQFQPDKFRSSKSRYDVVDASALDAKGRIENDWKIIEAALR